MSRLGVVLTIAAVLPLAGCMTLRETAEKRCNGQYPAGSAAYAACVQREIAHQLNEQDRYLERLREQERHGGY